MAWESVTPQRRRVYNGSKGCVVSISPKGMEGESGKLKRNSRLQIDAEAMDRLRLKLDDKVSWLVDHERKAVAFVLNANGTSTVCPGCGKSSISKRRVHIPKEVSGFIRDAWGVGRDDDTDSFGVELVLSNGCIEIKRKVQ